MGFQTQTIRRRRFDFIGDTDCARTEIVNVGNYWERVSFQSDLRVPGREVDLDKRYMGWHHFRSLVLTE